MLSGAGGEVFDWNKDPSKILDLAVGEIDDDDRTVRCSTDTIHQVAEEPAPQVVRAPCSDHQQVGALFACTAAHASGDVFIQAQQAAGSDLELITDHRRLGEALTGGCHGVIHTSSGFFKARTDQCQGQEAPLRLGPATEQS